QYRVSPAIEEIIISSYRTYPESRLPNGCEFGFDIIVSRESFPDRLREFSHRFSGNSVVCAIADVLSAKRGLLLRPEFAVCRAQVSAYELRLCPYRCRFQQHSQGQLHTKQILNAYQ